MRTGTVTKKLGMSIFFDEQGKTIPVTLLKIDDCQVIGRRTEEKDKTTALRIGYGKVKANRITKPLKGHFLKHKLDFKKNVADFKVSRDALLDIGTYVNASHYVAGQFIDVTGISIGKGFAGVMKRHGFRGLKASHGVSISHRAHGSTGHCQDPGKVFKGKKMAGRMGGKRVTISNLEIIEVDKENNILIVKGAVPGFSNSYVLVKDAKKRGLPADIPYPGIKVISTDKRQENGEYPKNVNQLESSSKQSDQLADIAPNADNNSGNSTSINEGQSEKKDKSSDNSEKSEQNKES